MYDDEGDDGWINKLFGISQGFPHQANYLLFGWRSRKDLGGIEILPYRHVKWEKVYWAADPNPTVVTPGTSIELEINTKNKDSYVFRADKRLWIIPREHHPWFPIGYTLKPYFGGTPTAPHSMNIELK